MTPDATTRNPPKVLTMAFFTKDYSIADTYGLLKTRVVYRLFGPTVIGSVVGTIPTINGLSRLTNTPNIDMTTDSYTNGISFGVGLDVTNMYATPTNNTFTASNSESSNNFGSTFGAGYTITSLFHNIFEQSTLNWQNPPANTATTCTIFTYIYNEIQSVGSNTHRHKKPIHTVFCPIDAPFAVNSAAANIHFLNPNYPLTFTTGFYFRSVITIAYSDQAGFLKAYRK